MKQTATAVLCFAGMIGILLLGIYWPGLSGGLVFDDQANIATIAIDPDQPSLAQLWQVVWNNTSGPLGRPLAVFSFALQIMHTGLSPYPMKLVNLTIHWASGLIILLVVWHLCRRLPQISKTGAFWLSAVITTLWLVHPFNLTSVAYIVQRMNSLSAFFVALTILFYLQERWRQQSRSGKWLKLLPLMGMSSCLALLSKENAVLLPVYLFTIEWFLFRFEAYEQRDRTIIRYFFALIFAVPVLLAAGILIFNSPFFFDAYQYRSFTLAERLLTELRVLSWYLTMIILPDIHQMTLYHDGLNLSRSLLSPLSTLSSAIVISVLLITALAWRNRYPWFGFGVCWFFGGHLLESTLLPLELVFEHRNYLPSLGLCFCLVIGARHIIKQLKITPKIAFLAALGAIALLSTATHARAYRWSGAPEAALMDALNHPESPRANIVAGNTYSLLLKQAADHQQKQRLFANSERHFERAYQLTPESANALFGWLFLYYEHHRQAPQKLLNELLRQLGSGAIDATTVNGLHSLTQCKIDGYCTLSDEYYLALMDAAFQNSNTLAQFAINILRDLARFHADSEKDNDTAILLTKRALEFSPNQTTLRFELIQYLSRAGYWQAAVKELQNITASDQIGRYRASTEYWQSALARFRPNRHRTH